MCGFAGFSDAGMTREDMRTTAEHMLAAVAHRGPDGAGRLHHRGVTLAHCALTFTDPVHQAALERLRGERRRGSDVEVELRPLARYDALIPA